jgi:DNA-binding transcriptional MerR regulator
MWMAELSSRTALSVPTIKFYLREGLMPAGEATGATRAKYDETHVRRLKLIRALTEVAGLRLDTVRQVLADIEGADNWHEAVGSAHTRLSPAQDEPASPASLERVQAMLKRNNWSLHRDSAHRGVLARALDTLNELEHPIEDDLLDAYADAMHDVADAEIAGLSMTDREAAAEHAVVGTLLLEPVLLTVRRIAQENAARTRASS